MITIDQKKDITTIEIKVKPAGIFFNLGAAPMIAMVSVLIFSEKIESPFGFFIGYLIFGLISFYLFRLLIWNSYGRELYIISNNELTSVNDFKWFKDNQRTTPFSDLKIMFADADRPSETFNLTKHETEKARAGKEYIIIFIVDDATLASVVKINAEHLKLFADKLQ